MHLRIFLVPGDRSYNLTYLKNLCSVFIAVEGDKIVILPQILPLH